MKLKALAQTFFSKPDVTHMIRVKDKSSSCYNIVGGLLVNLRPPGETQREGSSCLRQLQGRQRILRCTRNGHPHGASICLRPL